jgi:hypothetical protein
MVLNKKKRKKNVLLGNCPNCGLPMYDGLYGSIPMKETISSAKVQETLMLCKSCLSLPEGLSPDKIGENLLNLKLWEKEDVDLAVSAVQQYKDSKK